MSVSMFVRLFVDVSYEAYLGPKYERISFTAQFLSGNLFTITSKIAVRLWLVSDH